MSDIFEVGLEIWEMGLIGIGVGVNGMVDWVEMDA